MKPYGSKRSYDTEPRMKAGRALVKREGESEIEADLPIVEDREMVSTCGFCGCYYRSAEIDLHSCAGEVKLRDVEIGRLRGALAQMIIASEEGSASDAIQDMLEIAQTALEVAP